MASYNINQLAIVDSAILHLKNPESGELLWADEEQTLPVEIELHSTSSKQYRTAISAMQNRQIKRSASSNKKQATAEDMRAEGVQLLAAVSIQANNLDYNGAPLDNTEAFVKLYSDPKLSWLKEAVDSFLGDVAGFLPQ
jgi:hypothetical protein